MNYRPHNPNTIKLKKRLHVIRFHRTTEMNGNVSKDRQKDSHPTRLDSTAWIIPRDLFARNLVLSGSSEHELVHDWLQSLKAYNGLYLRWSACMLLAGWLPNKRLAASLAILLLDPSCWDIHKHFDAIKRWCIFVYITKTYAKLHRQSLDLTPRIAIVFPIVRRLFFVVFFVVVCPFRLTYSWITGSLCLRLLLRESTSNTIEPLSTQEDQSEYPDRISGRFLFDLRAHSCLLRLATAEVTTSWDDPLPNECLSCLLQGIVSNVLAITCFQVFFRSYMQELCDLFTHVWFQDYIVVHGSQFVIAPVSSELWASRWQRNLIGPLMDRSIVSLSARLSFEQTKMHYGRLICDLTPIRFRIDACHNKTKTDQLLHLQG